MRIYPFGIWQDKRLFKNLNDKDMKQISTIAEYEAIMERVDELVELVDDNTPPADKNYIELDFLTDLVVAYEKEHYPIGKPVLMDILPESRSRHCR
jgi:HTH-type transcriptional regulator/antitoxin HigA